VLDEIRECEWRIQALEIEILGLEIESDGMPTGRIDLHNLALERTHEIDKRKLWLIAQQARQQYAFDELLDWLGEDPRPALYSRT